MSTASRAIRMSIARATLMNRNSNPTMNIASTMVSARAKNTPFRSSVRCIPPTSSRNPPCQARKPSSRAPKVEPIIPHIVIPVTWATKQVTSDARIRTNWEMYRLPAASAMASRNLGTSCLNPTAGWGSIQMS